MSAPQTFAIVWDDIPVEITYRQRRWKSDFDHIELRAADGHILPVTETGYSTIRSLKRTGWKPVASIHSMDSEDSLRREGPGLYSVQTVMAPPPPPSAVPVPPAAPLVTEAMVLLGLLRRRASA